MPTSGTYIIVSKQSVPELTHLYGPEYRVASTQEGSDSAWNELWLWTHFRKSPRFRDLESATEYSKKFSQEHVLLETNRPFPTRKEVINYQYKELCVDLQSMNAMGEKLRVLLALLIEEEVDP